MRMPASLRSLAQSSQFYGKYFRDVSFETWFMRYKYQTLVIAFTVPHVVYFIYRYTQIDTGRSLYHEKYTIYRDSDPAVLNIRAPEEYTKVNWFNVRDNRHYMSGKADLGHDKL